MALPDTKILIVDDDEVDRRAVRRYLKKNGVENPVEEATDGQQALAILNENLGLGDAAVPYIVLLDLNMPVMNGHEFLEQLRQVPALSGTVVFVLTTSGAPEDIDKAYQRFVAGYMVKNSFDDKYSNIFQMLSLYLKTVSMRRAPIKESRKPS